MPKYVFNTTALSNFASVKRLELAKAKGVNLTGTLGILISLVRDNTISLAEANNMLTEMIKNRYRSPVNSLDNLI